MTTTGATEAVMPDHKRIWLSPRCDEYDERTWCEDDRGCCDDCGAPNTEYIRADIHATELATLRRRADQQYEALKMLVAVAENYLGTIVARRSAATQAAYAHALATANAALDVAPLPPGRNEG